MRGNVLTVSGIGAGAPVRATATIFSAEFDRNTELSVRLVSMSTILSMITMPLIIGLTQMITLITLSNGMHFLAKNKRYILASDYGIKSVIGGFLRSGRMGFG